MAQFPVTPAKEKGLRDKMNSLNIREEDIRESFVRSGGSGGQKVNKTSTCVYLKHIPTGVEIKCQRERSQSLNRYHARVLLVKKIEQILKGRECEERKRIEKIRRQKRRRSRRAKEKMLKEKKMIAEKKKCRSLRLDDETPMPACRHKGV
jgi:protein subunit release factor B